MRVFIAGAGGAIGRRLIPRFIERGHHVIASTRKPEKLQELRALGAEAVLMDGLDAGSVGEAVARAEPEVIVHQMTALAGGIDLKQFDDSFAMTNELRTRGTQHLLAAADAAGVRRFVAQGYAGWPNARDGVTIVTEDDPFAPHLPKTMRRTMEALRRQEQLLAAAPLETVVLRYGTFYGPGASEEMIELMRKRRIPLIGGGAGVWSWIHVDDAAAATVAAVECGVTGVFNVVDDEPARAAEWVPYLADVLGAKPPMRVPAWLARLIAGEAAVFMMTRIPGASNAKARRELGWQPRWSSWRQGFRGGLEDRHRPAIAA